MSFNQPKKRKYSSDSDEKDKQKKNNNDNFKVKKNKFRKLNEEITKDISYDKSVLKYNTPTIIYYNNKEFKINI